MFYVQVSIRIRDDERQQPLVDVEQSFPVVCGEIRNELSERATEAIRAAASKFGVVIPKPTIPESQ